MDVLGIFLLRHAPNLLSRLSFRGPCFGPDDSFVSILPYICDLSLSLSLLDMLSRRGASGAPDLIGIISVILIIFPVTGFAVTCHPVGISVLVSAFSFDAIGPQAFPFTA